MYFGAPENISYYIVVFDCNVLIMLSLMRVKSLAVGIVKRGLKTPHKKNSEAIFCSLHHVLYEENNGPLHCHMNSATKYITPMTYVFNPFMLDDILYFHRTIINKRLFFVLNVSLN